jgi:Fe-S-cluster containining protein
MRKSVTTKDITTFAKLDMIYNQVRMLEAQQNETEYKCLGSGKCCTIGLTIHMAECANIAFKLRQQYYLYLEDKGRKFADEWMDDVVASLKEAMFDETWQVKNGCTIYGFRPMICRTFGTITTVDDYCPRIKNANGNIDYYSGPAVKKIVQSFQDLLKEYTEGKDSGYDMVVYMPLGVLSFLLTAEELEELERMTDEKFWRAVDGWVNYRVQYTKEHGYGYDHLHEQAVTIGKKLVFDREII